jgi:signal peptidase I
MKNGMCFVNGKNFDEQLNLKVQFKIAATTLNLIDAEDQPQESSFDQYIVMGDSILITLDKTQVKKYQVKLGLIPFLLNDNYGPNGAFKWFDKNSSWTTDNFGPLKIPSGSYFVLGDNRHNAMDSRYIGFIKATDIKGVVLNK